MDLSLLKELLPLMRDCVVASFKHEGCELTFRPPTDAPPPSASRTASHPIAAPEATPAASPQAAGIRTEKVADSVLPQGLDEEMSLQKILEWSAPCADEAAPPNQETVPLTGDLSIIEPAIPEAPRA